MYNIQQLFSSQVPLAKCNKKPWLNVRFWQENRFKDIGYRYRSGIWLILVLLALSKGEVFEDQTWTCKHWWPWRMLLFGTVSNITVCHHSNIIKHNQTWSNKVSKQQNVWSHVLSCFIAKHFLFGKGLTLAKHGLGCSSKNLNYEQILF